MWKASAGHTVSITQDDSGADDWETDPDFVVSRRGPCFRPLGGSWGRVSGAGLTPQLRACLCLFQNDVSEKEQRWGAKTVRGSGHQEHIE